MYLASGGGGGGGSVSQGVSGDIILANVFTNMIDIH